MHDLDVRRVKKNIKTLEKLEKDGSLEPELAHKLALIECCGWIEEKMHCMMLDYIDKKVRNVALREEVKDSIKAKNYSFRYADFRDKLVATLTETQVIQIESFIKSYRDPYFDFERFKHTLGELKKKRDECAHTYARIGGSTWLGFYEIEEKLNYVNKGLNIFQSFVRRR